MVTRSLTQGRPVRTHEEYEHDIGKPDIPDKHPLIACAPHIMGGHAHLKSNKVTVERVLRALAHGWKEGPLVLSSGQKITAEEVLAVIAYAIDIFENVSKLYAELGRLRRTVPETRRSA